MDELVKVDELTKEISAPGGKYSSIITKAGSDLSLKVMDEKALTEVNDWMPVVNEKVASFSKQNSQTTASLMTLNMVDHGPFRIIRQIMAQVEKKRAALKEVMYKHAENELRWHEINDELKEELDDHKRARLHLERQKLEADAADSTNHIEAALKEIAAYKRRYEEILKNNDIPEEWSEEDFEAAEIEHHIKSIFRNAIRDRLQGGNNMGTMEYMEQFGINPAIGYGHVVKYLQSLNEESDINDLYEFLDAMYDKFKDEYKKAMERIGLDSITQSDFLMKNHT